MKILTVVYSLEKGGTQRAAQNFAEAYLLNGHDSKLLATSFGGIRHAELLSSGVQVWVNISKSVLSDIRAWAPDIVHLHSHELILEEVQSVLKCAKSAKVIETNVFSRPSPWVDMVDNSYQLSEWCQWLYKKRSKGKYPSEIVSYPVRTESFSRVSDENIKEFRKKYHIQESDVLVGRIGQAYDGKWSPLLIKVFNKLKSDSNSNHIFKLLLVNPPNSIRELASNSLYKQSIIVIDSIIGDENLAVAYSAIDIFVLIADIGESFGMVLTEAMLCETPIVAFSTPWVDNSQCEVVGNMEGGFIATKLKGLRNAIMTLADNPQLRKTMGTKGRQRVIDNFEYRKVARLALEKIDSIDTKKSSKGVPVVYFNSFDKPNLVSRFLLKNGIYLNLIKYFSGHTTMVVFFKRVIFKIVRVINNIKFTNNR